MQTIPGTAGGAGTGLVMACQVPGAVRGASVIFFNHHSNSWRENYDFPHYTDKEIGAKRDKVLCLKTYS